MKAAVLLLVLLPLAAACGDDPAPAPPPRSETWFQAPEEIARLIQSQDPGGIAWVPHAALAKVDVNDPRQLKQLTELLTKTVVARLTFAEDASFVLDLRAQDPDGAWRTVKATGTWKKGEDAAYTLTVKKRESLQLAPLEIPDELVATRVGKYLHLAALGRTIPLGKRDL